MRKVLSAALLLAMGFTAIQAASGAIFRGTPGSDVLRGTAQADELYWRADNDVLRGRGARDLVNGGSGRDRLSGDAGAEWLSTWGDGRRDSVQCGGDRGRGSAYPVDI